MSVRRLLPATFALIVVLLAGGCGEREGATLPAETDEPFYVQGKQLQRQGRNPEALTAFLKVIDKRGERLAPESHFEVGEIYLTSTKDPVEAYHHFRKYLELQPNSPQAELVRGRVKAALREFAKTVLGQPMSDQSLRIQADEEIDKLRRENNELRAELAVLRGGGAMPVNRSAKIINVPIETRPPVIDVPTTPVVNSPVTPTPPRTVSVAPPGLRPAPMANASPVTPARTAAQPPAISPARNAAAPRTATAATGRTHTVAKSDTLFSLSKKYGIRMEDIAAANGMSSVSAPLKLGTVLKIPVPGAR